MKCTKCKMPSTDQLLFINVTTTTTTTTAKATATATKRTSTATAATLAAATVATALTAAAAMQSVAVAAAAAATITNGTTLNGLVYNGFDLGSSSIGSSNSNSDSSGIDSNDNVISYQYMRTLQANVDSDNSNGNTHAMTATTGGATTTTTTAAAAAVAAALNLATTNSSNNNNASSISSAGSSASSATLANISGSLVEHLSTTLSSAAAAIIDTSGTTTTTTAAATTNGCSAPLTETLHTSYFGVQLAVPEWEALLTAIVLSVIIVLTIVGNILVILSVFTYKPLRIVQNFFIVSLAVADLTVALLVLPFNVAYSILGRWEFGIHLCKMWLTCDILCCTSSILNLCAIALDRYWAITDPINYAQKRTVGRVLLLISGVWILSLLISSPPLLGWNDWPDEFTSATPCELTSQRGYVIYSSLGSFFIPLVIMTIVYIEIYVATRRRLRERAKANKLNTIALKHSEAEAAGGGGGCSGVAATSGNGVGGKGQAITSYCAKLICCGRDTSNFAAPMIQNDQESISSETHVNHDGDQQHHQHQHQQQQPHGGEHRVVVVTQMKKSRRAKIKDSIKHGKARGRKPQTSATTSSSATAAAAEQRRTSQNDFQKQKDKSSAEQLLPASSNASAKMEAADANEISTESGSDPKGCIQVCVGTEHHHNNDDENAMLKITPPVSSTGAASSMTTIPLQKKPSGVYQFIEEKQKISLSKERRAARTLGIIMGVFVICWLPFFLMYVILPFCENCCPSDKFKNFITWLGYINSGLNPVIYTIFNLDYRRAFKRLLGIK